VTTPLTPPHNHDAELELLGAMLLDARVRREYLAQTPEEAFYRTAHRLVFAAMVTLESAGHDVDALALKAHLRQRGEFDAVGGDDIVMALLDVPTAANVRTAHRLVIECLQRRRMLDVLLRLAQATVESPLDVQALHTDALTDLLALGEHAARGGFSLLPIGDVLADIEARARGEATGLLTGFPELDTRVHGLRPGELSLLCGGPKVGKSTVAGQIALQVGMREPGTVAYVSAEMGSKVVTERMLAALAGVPYAAIRSGKLADDHYRRLARASGQLGIAKIEIDDTAYPRLDDITNRVLALKARVPSLRLVVVDYLQLVAHTMKGRRGDEELEEKANGLKRLAGRAQVAILAPVQLNLKSIFQRETKRPQLSDMAGGMGPLKACDLCVLLHRPALYGELPPGIADHMLFLVEATRNTPQFEFLLHWQGVVMRGIPPTHWIDPNEPLVPFA